MADRKGVLQINDILEEYSNDIQDGITNAAIQIADQGKDELKRTTNTYTVRTGKYNKGWAVEKRKGKGFIHTTIYNSTDWQLTHLLEKPHLKRDGKTYTRAFVHIAPVEEKCVNAFQRDVEEVVKNGG